MGCGLQPPCLGVLLSHSCDFISSSCTYSFNIIRPSAFSPKAFAFLTLRPSSRSLAFMMICSLATSLPLCVKCTSFSNDLLAWGIWWLTYSSVDGHLGFPTSETYSTLVGGNLARFQVSGITHSCPTLSLTFPGYPK